MGDTYTGKVVKTTQFGAFVELKKGTDGLLHVSNVGPGRVGHIEDVITRGDVLDVIVQEVDKARGRIGLKLVAKHEDGRLVQPEELIERAKDAPPRAARGGSPRRTATAAAAAAAATAARAATSERRSTGPGNRARRPGRSLDGAACAWKSTARSRPDRGARRRPPARGCGRRAWRACAGCASRPSSS